MKKRALLPDSPGVYLFKDKGDNIIYVGKALSLKKRVSQYFGRTEKDAKTRALVSSISDLEYIVTPTELDALILESNLIKEHKPRYNVCLKDDKQYPFIKITVKEDFPRIFLTRRKLQDGGRYFGPYTSARSVRETLKLINQIFKIRPCKKKITTSGRACLNFQMGLCNAPCSGMIDKERYRMNVDNAIRFLEGRNEELVYKLDERMQQYVVREEFESAAVIRDQLQALNYTVSARQHITGGFDDWDVVAVAVSNKTAAAQVLYIRDGSLVGRSEFTLYSRGADEGEVMSAFLTQYYCDAPVPADISLNILPEDHTVVEWLQDTAAGKLDITVPGRGRKKELVDMAYKNARSLLTMSLLKDDKREKSGHGALIELKSLLDLENLPHRVEAFDISNIGGTDAVGSMVVFTGGRPDKQHYRHYNIKTVEGIDDPAMMREVISRRLARIAGVGVGEENEGYGRNEEYGGNENNRDETPDLIVVDGGPAQLSAATGALQQWGLDIPVIGLAKQLESIHVPGRDTPLILPADSPGLTMLKHIRDESHRFAISHHRRRRSSRLRSSVLDEIPGVGKKRKEMLLRHFGSVDGIRAATLVELEQLSGISKGTAATIHETMASI
ncbi:MAG: excinuclease ABC subunit UvrC [ANME-2 cluster archaeon]|jgi:excinuclease ABC subunit C|nr:excinuclease ABC subunit UvrC [ANME-2 cluster archaeon]